MAKIFCSSPHINFSYEPPLVLSKMTTDPTENIYNSADLRQTNVLKTASVAVKTRKNAAKARQGSASFFFNGH